MPLADLQARLAELVEEHDVAGAAVGVLHEGDVTAAAAGFANRRTGVEATPDTLFQIGSQGKMWTATVLMQLADEGLVDVDATVRTYLPDFAVADAQVSQDVTLLHLLTHTSGIDGDNFADFGRGDDCLERYVESCATLGQTHPLGATMSYCNTGFSILGRVIEVVTGKVWDAVMRERLFDPLGLSHTCTLPEEALLHRTAVGHVATSPGAPLEVAPVWMLPRACGPMGLINSTVGDVLTFARLHLDSGKGAEGDQLVSTERIGSMLEPQVASPDPHTLGTHWGLGVILFEWDGHRVYGHDGGTIGQSSRLRIVPDADLAIALVANGGAGTQKVYEELFGELVDELAGITMPGPLQAPHQPPEVDLERFAGSYQRLSVRYDLAPDDGTLVGTVTLSGPIAEVTPNPMTRVTFIPVAEETFLVHDEESETPAPAVFYELHDGIPQYLHSGARANPRVAD
jgi:CubicO group peptidase (beta-lactamase class C family)